MDAKGLKILLVESDLGYVERCIRELGKAGFEVHHVNYVYDFERIFNEHGSDWSAVIMDVCQYSSQYNTSYFVKYVRKKTGDRIKIIANSSSSEYNEILMKVGCNVRSTGGKFRSWALPGIIKRVLNIR